jgi:hypothetical protein
MQTLPGTRRAATAAILFAVASPLACSQEAPEPALNVFGEDLQPGEAAADGARRPRRGAGRAGRFGAPLECYARSALFQK